MRVIKITDHRADGSESFTIYLEDPTNDEVYEYLRGNRLTTLEFLSEKKTKGIYKQSIVEN